MRAPSGESWYQSIGGKDDKRCRIVGDDNGAHWIDFRLATDQRMKDWRYASASEVHAMFAAFLHNSDGRSTNPTAERVLQSGLRGPLEFCGFYETGWCRESSWGYAKIDAVHFALVGYVAKESDPHGISITIDPEIQGNSTTADQGFQQSGSGSYLVQDAGRQ